MAAAGAHLVVAALDEHLVVFGERDDEHDGGDLRAAPHNEPVSSEQ